MPSSCPVARNAGSGWNVIAVTHDGAGMAVSTCPDDGSHKVRSLLAEASTRASLMKHHEVSRSLRECQATCRPLAGSQCRRMPGSSTDHSVPSGANVKASKSPLMYRRGSPKTALGAAALAGRVVEAMKSLAWETFAVQVDFTTCPQGMPELEKNFPSPP